MTAKKDVARDRKNELTQQQARFCAEYVATLNGAEAARLAGYSVHSARTLSIQMLKRPHIAAEVRRLEKIQLERAGLTAAGVLEQLRRIAYFDMADIYEVLPSGEKKLKHPVDWPIGARMALSNYETVVRNLTSGDGKTDDVLKVRFEPKLVALEMLAKHMGLLIDRTEQVTELRVTWLAPEPAPATETIPAAEVKRLTPGETLPAYREADVPEAAPAAFDPHREAIRAAMAEHQLSEAGVLRMFPELRAAKKRSLG